MKYDLTQEPWIPCQTTDGDLVELGIFDVLRGAHEIEDIVADNPPMRSTLLRMLIALVRHASFGNVKRIPSEDWRDTWRAGRFSDDVVRYVEDRKAAFDLFDELRPFAQIPGLEVVDSNKVKGQKVFIPRPSHIGSIIIDRPSGNNATLFDHVSDDDCPPLTPAQAARHMLTYMQNSATGNTSAYRASGFDLLEKPGYSSFAPLRKGYCVTVQGQNLFETILLNVFSRTGTLQTERDEPWWDVPAEEIVKLARKGTQQVPKGVMSLYTWPTRLLRLVELDGMVVGVHDALGIKIPSSYPDPMKMYRESKDGETVPVSPLGDRGFWRDFGAAICGAKMAKGGVHKHGRTAAIDRLSNDASLGIPRSRRMSLRAIAVDGNQGGIYALIDDSTPLPVEVLGDQDRAQWSAEAIEIAESEVQFLERLIKGVLRRRVSRSACIGMTDKLKLPKTTYSILDDCRSFFWSAIRTPYLDAISEPDTDVAQRTWRAAVGSAMNDTFDHFLDHAGRDSKMVLALQHAPTALANRIRKLESQGPKAEKEGD